MLVTLFYIFDPADVADGELHLLCFFFGSFYVCENSLRALIAAGIVNCSGGSDSTLLLCYEERFKGSDSCLANGSLSPDNCEIGF